MWYVVQVRSGTEDRIVRQCQNVIDAGVLERCFVPYYEERKKYHGTWHTEKRILFPGYVFMVSSQLTALHKSLQGVIGMTRLLGTGNEIVGGRDRAAAENGCRRDADESVGGHYRKRYCCDNRRTADRNGRIHPQDRPPQAESVAGYRHVRADDADRGRAGDHREKVKRQYSAIERGKTKRGRGS